MPYPYAAGDHQLKNAEALEREGASVCVPSGEVTKARIAQQVDELVSDGRLAEMASRARKIGRPEAAATIARDLLSLAGLAVGSGPVEQPAPHPCPPDPPERVVLQEAR